MSGATTTAINNSKTILSTAGDPNMSGSGKKVVIAPKIKEGKMNIKMKIYTGAFII
mgnify:CR=1 FL=1